MYQGSNGHDKFWSGTKYIKVLILDNYHPYEYGNPTTNTYYSGITFRLKDNINNYTVDLSGHEPLRCVGEVCDYIDYDNWQIVRNVGKISYDGSESWNYVQNTDSSYGSFYLNNTFLPLANTNSLNEKLVCTHFPYVYSASAYKARTALGIMGYSDSSAAFMITAPSSVATSSASFKTWLAGQNSAGTPLTIYYKLKNTTTEKLNMPEIKTYEGNTIVSITDGTTKPSKIITKYYKKDS